MIVLYEGTPYFILDVTPYAATFKRPQLELQQAFFDEHLAVIHHFSSSSSLARSRRALGKPTFHEVTVFFGTLGGKNKTAKKRKLKKTTE